MGRSTSLFTGVFVFLGSFCGFASTEATANCTSMIGTRPTADIPIGPPNISGASADANAQSLDNLIEHYADLAELGPSEALSRTAFLIGTILQAQRLPDEAVTYFEDSAFTAHDLGAGEQEIKAFFALALSLVDVDLLAGRTPADNKRSLSLLRFTQNSARAVDDFDLMIEAQIARISLNAEPADAIESLIAQTLLDIGALPTGPEKDAQLLRLSAAASSLENHSGRSLHALAPELAKMAEVGSAASRTIAHGLLGRAKQHVGSLKEALSETDAALLGEAMGGDESLSFVWLGQRADILAQLGTHTESLEAYRLAAQEIARQTALDHPILPRSWIESRRRETLSAYIGKLLDSDIDTQTAEDAQAAIELLRQVEFSDTQGACVTDAALSKATYSQLPDDAAIIYLTEVRGSLRLLLISDVVEQVQLDVQLDTLSGAVAELRGALLDPTSTDVKSRAATVFDYFLAPLVPALDRTNAKVLVFAPEGAMQGIPIGSLYNAETGRYVVEDYAVATIVGLTLSTPAPLTDNIQQIFLAGVSNEVGGFSALPYVPMELDNIARILPRNVTMLLDSEFSAQKMGSLFETKAFDIVHLATHAEFGPTPSDSFLLTGAGRLDLPGLEQLVQLARIRGRPIELLALSACETAAGSDQAVLGLAGAAFRAGARSVFASLWPVADSSTATLVSDFYDGLLTKRLGRAEALRQAQIRLLNSTETEHPYFWAGFVIVGNWM